MTRRTAGTSPARYSNHFEPNPDSMPPDDLLSTAEVAELLSLTPAGVRKRAERRHLNLDSHSGKRHYWTRRQVERLRSTS